MLTKFLCFLVPMAVGIKLDVAGGLFAAELILPFFALIQLPFRKSTSADQHFYIILSAGLVFLLGLVLSDLWNETSYNQYSRGWSRVIVFLLNFSSIYLLVNHRRSRLLLMAAGLAAGRIWLSFSTMDGDMVAWKLGLAKPVTLIMFILCVTIPFLKGPKNLLTPTLIIVVGLANIVADFRSLGGVLVIVGALLAYSALRRSFSVRGQARSAFPLLIVGLCSVSGAYQFYSFAAQSGWLSERAKDKYEAQVTRSDASLLVAGRSEFLVSIEAILDAPILGHGSWPEDPYYAKKLASQRFELGINNYIAAHNSDLIPTHSHLLGGWVEAGFAGGAFWALVLFFVRQALSKSLQGHSHMRPLYIYCSVLLVWDILFSPFAGFRRVESAFLLVVVLRALLQSSRSGNVERSLRKRIAKRKRGHRKKSVGAGAPGAKQPHTA